MKLEKAKALLKEGGHTCVFVTEKGVFTFEERGIKPLWDVLNSDMVTANAAVADKVVGKAAAFLYELMGIGALYAHTVSEAALTVLQRAKIQVEYETLAPCIRNRANTGQCPMESAVWGINDAREARKVLENRVKGGKYDL